MRQRLPATASEVIADDTAEVQSAPWSDIVEICTKCARKRDDLDHKGKPALRNVFKDAFKSLGVKKRVRVMESACFGLCPKHGQTVAVGSELVNGTLRVVRDHDEAEKLATVIAARIGPKH